MFDAAAESRQSSAFVGGMKILLPADVERSNDKTCEEVLIPAARPRARMGGEKHVGPGLRCAPCAPMPRTPTHAGATCAGATRTEAQPESHT